MSNKNNRRSFIKHLTVGGLGAAALPGSLLADENHTEPDAPEKQASKQAGFNAPKRAYNSGYEGANLNRLAFPVGGLGAGMFCLEGTGAISHMSVRHKPELFNEPGMFAAIYIKGLQNGAKILEGPVPEWKAFGQRGAGNGVAGTTFGLPRFSQVKCTPRFPFSAIDMEDGDIPLKVKLTGWSPFIPGDADNSGLPATGLEYTFTNTGKANIGAVFSYNSRNFMVTGDAKGTVKSMPGGFVLTATGTPDKPFLQGNFSIFTDAPSPVIDHCWFRGAWWDPLTMVWNTIKEGKTRASKPVDDGAPGASLYVPLNLNAGQTETIRVFMAWYVPDSDMHIGDVTGESVCAPEKNLLKTYKPWYSSRFKSIQDVSAYWKNEYQNLRKKTALFTDAFYASTLPAEVMEAVAANLTILKSPTVMRQFDGRLWNFEGCGDDGGCCHGSCTHVWNYAQAIPHLFPELERTLRNTEFCENQNKEGHQGFRANTPISPVKHDFHAAADGQLGGIMKVYREWRISGDDKWLAEIYPRVKSSMDYCMKTWDPRSVGAVEEPHHNTYDIEFWGADGMCTSFYLGALQATMKMGKHLKKDISTYKNRYEKGQKYMEEKLYDGEYFIQQIDYKHLNAPNPAEAKSFGGKYSDEAQQLLQQEGPKYQYGKGCLSDGVLGVWMARMCFLDDPINPEKAKSHITAVHKYNLKKDLSDHANPQRPGYALGKEGGLLLCTWPKGGKLSLPFVYSDEVWTGIEYQVASHLMLTGEVQKGLDIVQTCRNRYDGRVRNPFNEYECGSWYGRALSSYGCLQGMTGLLYDAVDKTLHIDSQVGDFTCFLSTQNGFGTVSFKNGKAELKTYAGKIEVKKALSKGRPVKFSIA